ncbi:hypothetical protein Tco_1557919, partial [Tanacetum coccineum]
ESRVNQEKEANVNSTNTINTVSSTINAAGIEDNVVDDNIVYGCADDPNMHELEEIGKFSDAKDDISGADMNNFTSNKKNDKEFGGTWVLALLLNKEETIKTFKIACLLAIEGFKLDRSYAGRASTIQVTRSLDLEMFVSADGIKWFLLEDLEAVFLLVMFSFLLTDIESADLNYRRDYCMQEL